MDLVACKYCGGLHKRGSKCPFYRPKRKYNREGNDKLRSSYAWTKKAKQIKDDANYLCEVCRDKGKYTHEDLEVHHITKLREDASGLLEDSNLICLCQRHHRQADDGELDADYLRKLVKVRQGLVKKGAKRKG